MCKNESTEFYLTVLDNGWKVGKFRALDELDCVTHMVTTREGPDTVLCRDDPSTATKLVAEAMGVDGAAWCEQIHGRGVLPATGEGCAGKADALVTNMPLIALSGLCADCPIILVADPVSSAVGMAHASWRGTVGRIASEMIVAMSGRYSVNPKDVVACICPSAGPCCYEVGSEVIDAVIGGIGRHARAFFQERDNKTYFDLWAANAEELLRVGLEEENIHYARLCTVCGEELFPSYRREGGQAGRFVGAIAPL